MYHAVIDAGYNSFRIVIYEVFSNGTFRTIGSLKYFVRIGQGLEEGKFISEDRIEEAEIALKNFKKILDSNKKIEDVKIVATSAFRYASNGEEASKRLSKVIGKEIRIVSGEEEGRYSAIGMLNTLPISSGILFELGGGSLEIIEVNSGNISKVYQLPLGALKLSKSSEKEIRKKVDDNLSTTNLKNTKILVGSGGNVRALAKLDEKLSSFNSRSIHGYFLPSKQINKYATVLQTLDLEDRSSLPGISKDRALTIHSAAIILDELAKYFGVENILVSSFGMREGVLTEGKKLDRNSWLEGIALSHCVDPPHAIMEDILSQIDGKYSFYIASATYLASVFKMAGYLNPYDICYRFTKNAVMPGFTLNEAILIGLLCKSVNSKVKKRYIKAINEDISKKEIYNFGKIIKNAVNKYIAGVRI
ncbi:Ppx/GppA phosphatase family protein [Acidianus manzaensis]|uniref:Exopolyphosphatase n=1 Tax=Acidianus manzaensis TaxID=282676 RepID=A0A1W6JZF9_9CREN|nr:Ppx/GppA phosphatase family protein [Acidianus manzaensis]ARM75627.1 exopolyphosphatase [Acidianus manzaensis]